MPDPGTVVLKDGTEVDARHVDTRDGWVFYQTVDNDSGWVINHKRDVNEVSEVRVAKHHIGDCPSLQEVEPGA